MQNFAQACSCYWDVFAIKIGCCRDYDQTVETSWDVHSLLAFPENGNMDIVFANASPWYPSWWAQTF